MAARVRHERQGTGKVTRRESFKVSHMLNHRLATGASSQGFGPHTSQVMATKGLDALEEELEDVLVGCQFVSCIGHQKH